MQKTLSFLFVLLMYSSAIGQSADLNQKNTLSNPVPAFYLQTDRDTYFSGDTVWAKGFSTANHNNGNSLYSLTVELANLKEQKILSTQTFLASRNTASAIIDLPTDLPTGTYLIRAYSRGILEQKGVVFTKLVKVHNLFNKEKEMVIYKRELVFYPEGGRFIAGDTNHVAFIFTDRLGKPSAISGKIVNAAGTFICSFVSKHNGMGIFSLRPQVAESYFAIIDDAPAIKYPLPGFVVKGVQLTVQNDSNQISFSIKSHLQDSVNQPVFLVLQMGKKAVYEVSLEKNMGVINGAIPVHEFRSGVARLCVYNKDTLLLAERLCFIDNKEYVLPANLSISLLSKDYRAENLFSLNLDEPVPGTFSVSVTDAGFEEPGVEKQNIFSSSLLSRYLKNRVYNAGKYFNGEYKNSTELLDLVMLTNSWGGVKWEEGYKMMADVKTERESLTGRVFYKDTRRPFINSPVVMVALSNEDTTTQTFTFITDNTGKFKTNKETLFGRNRLLFFSSTGKKRVFIDVELDQPNATAIPFRFPEIASTEKATDNHSGPNYDSLTKSWGYLKEIIVEAKPKNRAQLLEGRYSTGRFKELFGEVYDLTAVKSTSGNILDYLMMRNSEIKVELDDRGEYVMKVRMTNGTFVRTTSVYLDEIKRDIEVLYAFKAEDLAIIKVVGNLEIGPNGFVPGIAIYTRRGRDFTAAANNYDIEYYDGFSKPGQFYSPVYKQEQPSTQTDNRITLLWNPKAATSKRINFIPVHFYNNDFTKVFKLVIEGTTEDGRLLYFEKIL